MSLNDKTILMFDLHTPSLMPLDRPKLSKDRWFVGRMLSSFIAFILEVNTELIVSEVARVNLDHPEKIKTKS